MAPRPVVALFLMTTLAAACGGSSPSSPAAPAPTPPATGTVTLTGRVVDALTSAGMPGLSVSVAGSAAVVSDTDGRVSLAAVSAGLQQVAVSGAAIVQRDTALTFPGSGTVSIVPSSFDLASFNEMFRSSGRLQRWTAAASLVIVARTLQFTATADNEFTVLDEQMSDEDLAQMQSDLSAGFDVLTGGGLGSFPAVTIERPSAGDRVLVKRTGLIVVARHKGLTQATRYWGYGRWATAASGQVVGGIVFLDRDFEVAAGPYRRSLRIHELGHALGYDHVTLRTSAMNSAATVEPNAWDRQAVAIAFQRPPGNRPPDIDPAGYSGNTAALAEGGEITWGPWIW